jgi:hypothetical protein
VTIDGAEVFRHRVSTAEFKNLIQMKL